MKGHKTKEREINNSDKNEPTEANGYNEKTNYP